MPKNTRYPKGTPLWASQNFLTSRAGIRRLIGLADIGSSDHVLEIGPGKGHITRELLPRCGRLTAVELDPRLWAGLRERFAGEDKLELIKEDFLKYPLPKGPYKVFANLPFSGTSAILKKLPGPDASLQGREHGVCPVALPFPMVAGILPLTIRVPLRFHISFGIMIW